MTPILLNLPWSFMTLLAAVVSFPYKIKFHRKPFAVIIFVRSFWWKRIKGVRATTAGSVILCSPRLEANDIEHELVHVEQYYREPFIHPFLYLYQSVKHGYRNNKYEIEAYDRSGNVYKGSEVVTRKYVYEQRNPKY